MEGATGAGSAIGKTIALAFAAQGSRVVAANLDEAAATATADQQPEPITALPIDVADPHQVDTQNMAMPCVITPTLRPACPTSWSTPPVGTASTKSPTSQQNSRQKW
ncbi:SDR family NAD(P)-dependent oxidoreductase [Mycobacterium lepromatosis]|uniref:SDR family NAD(P)-dependent oxidoreductase n=1 Tax=Mycobacterium lepromatosis TaxID=480418 RepID=UPI000679BE57